MLYLVTRRYHNLQKKTTEKFTTQTARLPSSPDMATCISRCLSKSASLSKDPTVPFHFFREVLFFCDSFCFLENCSQRVVWSSGGPFGWCCLPSSLLLGGAAWPLPSLGGVAFLPILWVEMLITSLLLGKKKERRKRRATESSAQQEER